MSNIFSSSKMSVVILIHLMSVISINPVLVYGLSIDPVCNVRHEVKYSSATRYEVEVLNDLVPVSIAAL